MQYGIYIIDVFELEGERALKNNGCEKTNKFYYRNRNRLAE